MKRQTSLRKSKPHITKHFSLAELDSYLAKFPPNPNDACTAAELDRAYNVGYAIGTVIRFVTGIVLTLAYWKWFFTY